VARHQWNLLQLPRAAAASSSERRAARKRMTNRIAENLLWQAAHHLPAGKFRVAYSHISVALELAPLCALRPAAYKKLVRNMIMKTRTRFVLTTHD
jgi:hypothetical protein